MRGYAALLLAALAVAALLIATRRARSVSHAPAATPVVAGVELELEMLPGARIEPPIAEVPKDHLVRLVVLNHGDGYYTIYSHLSEVSVARGSEVQSGAVIGRSGEEGSLKGPVVHFEVRKGATALDPVKYLSSATALN